MFSTKNFLEVDKCCVPSAIIHDIPKGSFWPTTPIFDAGIFGTMPPILGNFGSQPEQRNG
jgi:hypothetical protein